MENMDATYLAKLQDHYAKSVVLPPYSVIMGIVGLKSKASVAALVYRLKLQGYLEATPQKRLKPGKHFFERAVYDSVRAGFPAPAGDMRHAMLAIDEYLVQRPSCTVLVKVKGDSMIDVGIMPGDTVVVEKRPLANLGEMVIAIIDNEFTLKILGKEGNSYVLIPANPAYPVLRTGSDLEIFGVVVGQFRKYR